MSPDYTPQENAWRGQGLLEYAMIMLLVALIVIVVLMLLGPPVANMFSQVLAGF